MIINTFVGSETSNKVQEAVFNYQTFSHLAGGELLKLKIFAAYFSFITLLLKTSQCCVQTTVALRVKTQQHYRKHKHVLGKKKFMRFYISENTLFSNCYSRVTPEVFWPSVL